VSAGETVFASAADVRYGHHAVNLVASIQANSDIFDRIVVFDLGMNDEQRRWLHAAPAVELPAVPPFVPHWNRGFTWKPWAWVHVGGDTVIWIDAGATVLRSLAPMVDQARDRGYFLVSQQAPVSDILPDSYFDMYELPRAYKSRPYAAAGILGFRRESAFFEEVVLPTYDDCVRGRSLGFSAREAIAKNVGLAKGPTDVIHDCPHFRWDQSVFNARLLQALPDAQLADVNDFGWRSPTDSPGQLVWNHRRRGSLRYLKRLRTTARARPRWFVTGVVLQLRWWMKLHRHTRDRAVLKARRVARQAHARVRR
jgi:hypothetical protein